MSNKITRGTHYFPLTLVLYEVCNYLANDAYLPALPLIAEELHLPMNLVQLTLTVFFLGNASVQLFLGPITDRYGRRFLLLGSGLVFIATTLVWTVSSNIHVLLISRFLQGASVNGMLIAGYATIHSLFDKMRAIKTLAWMGSVTILAPTLGPIFGALILQVANWRWIFIVLAVWAIIAWLALYHIMPETCERPIPISISTIMRQYWAVVRNKKFLKPMIALSILFAVLIAWMTAGPFMIMENMHYSSLTFSFMQAAIFGACILGNHWVKYNVEKMTLKKITQLSILVAAVGGFLAIGNFVYKQSLFMILIPMILFGFGTGIGFPVFNRLAIEGSTEPMGIRMALFSFFLGISSLIGSMVVSIFPSAISTDFFLLVIVFSIALLPLLFLMEDN